MNWQHEEFRLRSFNYWSVNFIDPNRLAMTGCYYTGHSDTVHCHFCRVEIGRWEPGDDEVNEHLRWSANCPLLRRRETNNVPIDATLLDQILPPVTFDVSGGSFGIDIREHTIVEGTFEPVVPFAAIVTSQPMQPVSMAERTSKYPNYAIEEVRLRSYIHWPKMMNQKVKQLADAGLFYTSIGDRVRCFSCGCDIVDWDENDDPWKRHALWFSNCEYLKLVKGQKFIDAVLAADEKKTKTEPDKEPALDIETVSTAPDEEAGSMCKLCLCNEYETVYLPCGHVAACAKCAYSVSTCPICRTPYERVVRVYLT